jgi:hypothetical protein
MHKMVEVMQSILGLTSLLLVLPTATPWLVVVHDNTQPFMTSSSLSAIKNNGDIDLTRYDFASKNGWDDFYQQNNKESSGSGTSLQKQKQEPPSQPLTPFQFEWHSSIDFIQILSIIKDENVKNVLLPGNGNSNLPKIIYDHCNGCINVTCLDYSQSCIDMLKMIHNDDDDDDGDGEFYSNMEFICGDAINLKGTIENHYRRGGMTHTNNEKDKLSLLYDMIIDKGLMDAIMCNEDWNDSLEKYFQGASQLLKKDGKILLFSYKLSTSAKEFLIDVVGENIGIAWDLDIDNGSNDRVSFSIGNKII